MEVITITNQKGGVAKTTTAWSIGNGLHKHGYTILFIDLDAQSNLSFTAGVDLLNLKTSLYDVFKGQATINEAIENVSPGIDIITGSIDLASADREFTQLAREKMLQKALKTLKNKYDYCIIDTPPTLSVMNENALTVSNSVIIPMQAEIYALQGIKQLYGFIQEIRENVNPGLKIDGILITRVDERTSLFKQMRPKFEEAAEGMGTKLYKTYIRHTVSVPEVALQRGNLFDEVPNATATKDYTALVNEFLQMHETKKQ